jgi:hypothetical protein
VVAGLGSIVVGEDKLPKIWDFRAAINNFTIEQVSILANVVCSLTELNTIDLACFTSIIDHSSSVEIDRVLCILSCLSQSYLLRLLAIFRSTPNAHGLTTILSEARDANQLRALIDFTARQGVLGLARWLTSNPSRAELDEVARSAVRTNPTPETSTAYSRHCKYTYYELPESAGSSPRCSEIAVRQGYCEEHWNEVFSDRNDTPAASAGGPASAATTTVPLCSRTYNTLRDGMITNVNCLNPVHSANSSGYCQYHFNQIMSPMPLMTGSGTSPASTQSVSHTEAEDDGQETAAVAQDCTICMDKKRNAVFIPCGHMAACYKCAIKVKNICPICRVSIKSVTKVYL